MIILARAQYKNVWRDRMKRIRSQAVDALVELHAVDEQGHKAFVTTTVQELIGRPPRAFIDFARASCMCGNDATSSKRRW